jgi:hypothetical protein
MNKVYFDDLFFVLDLDDNLFLCEHVPYEKHRVLLHVKTKHDHDSTRELIQKIILSEEFKALNLNVIGIPHRLSNK